MTLNQLIKTAIRIQPKQPQQPVQPQQPQQPQQAQPAQVQQPAPAAQPTLQQKRHQVQLYNDMNGFNDIVTRTPEVAQRMGSMPGAAPAELLRRAGETENQIIDEQEAAQNAQAQMAGNDYVNKMEQVKNRALGEQAAREYAQEQQRKQWLASPEGQAYTAGKQREANAIYASRTQALDPAYNQMNEVYRNKAEQDQFNSDPYRVQQKAYADMMQQHQNQMLQAQQAQRMMAWDNQFKQQRQAAQDQRELENRNRQAFNEVLARTPEVAQRMGSMPGSSPIDQRIRAEQAEQEIQQERTAQAYNQRLSEIPNEIHDVILNTMLTDENGNWLPQMPSQEVMDEAVAELRSMYPAEVVDAGLGKVVEDLNWLNGMRQSVVADWAKLQEAFPDATPEQSAEMLQVIADKNGINTDNVSQLINMGDIYIPTLGQPDTAETTPQEIAVNTTQTGAPVSAPATVTQTAAQPQGGTQVAGTGKPGFLGDQGTAAGSQVTTDTVANSPGFMAWAQQNPTTAALVAALMVGGITALGTSGGSKKDSSLGLLLALLLAGGTFFGAKSYLTPDEVAATAAKQVDGNPTT